MRATDRIEALGRSGQVSESVLRYQNRELAKADGALTCCSLLLLVRVHVSVHCVASSYSRC